MKKRVVMLSIVVVLLIGLLFARQNFTGLIVNQESRYQQLRTCMLNGGQLNPCRLQLGVLTQEDYQSRDQLEVPAPPNSLNVKDLGAFGDGESHPLTTEDITSHPTWNGKYHLGDEWDTVAIQEAIDNNPEQKIIFIPRGTYLIYQQNEKNGINVNIGLKFVSSTHLQGAGATESVLKNRDSDDVVTFEHFYIPLQDVQVDALQFDGITISFAGGTLGQMNNLAFRNCAFNNGVKPISTANRANPDYLPNTQILEFSRVRTAVVDNCRFTLDAEHPGRGILIWSSHDITVENSVFSGALQTGVNIQGALSQNDKDIEANWPIDKRSHKIVIRNNLLQRNLPPGIYEDHGIYGWGMNDLEISNNYLSGWTKGGSIKVRNGEMARVRCNEMHDEGITLYNYVKGALQRIKDNKPDGFGEPPYLRDVLIENNLVVDPVVDGEECASGGIEFWRDAGEHDRTDFESQIVINQNTFNGCIKMNNPIQGSAFSLTNNKMKSLVIGSYVGPYSNQSNQVCEECTFERTLPQECGSVPQPQT